MWYGRYADKLVEHAKQMLEFGIEHPGSYMKSKLEGLKDHGKHYPSTNYNDEMALGAVWLYFATGVSALLPHHLLLLGVSYILETPWDHNRPVWAAYLRPHS